MNRSRLFRRLAASAIAVLIVGLVPSAALAGAMVGFTVQTTDTGSTLVTTGIARNYTITAIDGVGATVSSYTGSVNVSCSDGDPSVVCPASVGPFVGGVATMDVTLITLGASSIDVADQIDTGLVGGWSGSVLASNVPTHLVVTAPATAAVGTAVTVNVVAKDDTPQTATTYNGTAVITSTDGTASFSPPSPAGFTSGTASFDVTFGAIGSPTVTVTDGALTGTSGAVTVSQGTPTITWATPAGITYGTALSATQLNATADVAGSFVYVPPSGTVLTAGSHTLQANFTPTDTTNWISTSKTVSIGVGQATPVINWSNPAAITYGTALSATQLNASVVGGIAGTLTYLPVSGTVLDAGGSQQLQVTFHPTDTTDYSDAVATVHITVNPKPITVTATAGQTKVYGASDPAFAYTITSGGPLLVGSDVFSGALARAAGANVGTYAINQGTLTAGGNGGANYTITFVGANFAITAKPITVTVDSGQSKRVNTTDPTLTFTVTVGGPLVAGDVWTGALVRDAGETVGTYAIHQGTIQAGGNSGLNYTITFVGANFQILAQIVPTITWSDPAAITYGTALSGTQLNASVVGGIAGTFVYSPISGTVLDAGAGQALQVTFHPTDTVTYANAVATVHITVNAKAITVTATSGQTKVYGDTDPTFTYSITAGGPLVGSDAFSGALSRDVGENVGATYALHQNTLEAGLNSGLNYTITFVSANFSITTKHITVTANPGQAKVAGASEPVYTYTITSGGPLVTGDTFSGTLHRAVGESVGFYAFDIGTLQAGGNGGLNYTILFVNNDFEIVPPSNVTEIDVVAPATATAGTAFDVTVTAKGSGGATVTGYVGTVTFTSNDPAANFPFPTYQFKPSDHGTVTFSNQFAFNTVAGGSKTITATDLALGSLSGTSAGTTVSPGAVSTYAVSSITNPVIPGTALTVTLTAQDAHANTITNYTGTVHFTSSDPAATLPANYTFLLGDSGVKTFTNGVTLMTFGTRTLTVTDAGNGAVTATVSGIVVGYPTTTYYPIGPARVLDTRAATHIGTIASALVKGSVQTFLVANAPFRGTSTGVPLGAVAVTGNLTVSQADAAGDLALGPYVTSNNEATTLNFGLKEDRANNVTVGLAPDGTLQVVYQTTGAAGSKVDVIFDVSGYFMANTGGVKWHPIVTPGRVLDTRRTTATVTHIDIVPAAKFQHGVIRNVKVRGVVGVGWSKAEVPAGATAITANVTVTGSSSDGYVLFAPAVTSPITSSTLNTKAGAGTANGITIKLNSSGNLQAVWRGTAGSTADVILDVTGYFLGNTGDATGLSYHPITPYRYGNSVPPKGGLARFTSEGPQSITLGGQGELPTDAIGISGNLTLVSPTASGFAFVGPVFVIRPPTSTVNALATRTYANGFDAKLSSATNGKAWLVYCGIAGAQANMQLDVTGYWK